MDLSKIIPDSALLDEFNQQSEQETSLLESVLLLTLLYIMEKMQYSRKQLRFQIVIN